MNRTPFDTLITRIATEYRLPPELIEAVVLQESGGDPFAWNPEPRYRWLWNVRTNKPFRSLTSAEQVSEVPPADFPTLAGDRDQEFWAQQASWGLMQIMGALGRELGCRWPYLTKLLQVELNLQYGCAHLGGLLRWANGKHDLALAAYNGGKGNPQFGYAKEVLARVQGDLRA